MIVAKQVGDKVIYEGQIATVISRTIPKCKCKGKGYYKLAVEGERGYKRVPITTELEDYNPIGLISTNVQTHNIINNE